MSEGALEDDLTEHHRMRTIEDLRKEFLEIESLRKELAEANAALEVYDRTFPKKSELELHAALEAANARIAELEGLLAYGTDTSEYRRIRARAELANARIAELEQLIYSAQNELGRLSDSRALLSASLDEECARAERAEAERDKERLLRKLHEDAAKDWQPRAERAEAECKAMRQNFAAYLVPAYKANPVEVARICDEQLDQSGALLGYVRDKVRAALNPSEAKSK